MIKVAFLVSGDQKSPMAYRARAFAERVRDRYEIQIAYRERSKIVAAFRFLSFLRRFRPDLTYVFDISYSAVLGAWLHQLLLRDILIVETGDAIYELMRSSGNRGPVGLWLTRALENFSLRIADRVVVRGSYHQKWLAKQGIAADVLPDGVDVAQFVPRNAAELRQQYGVNGELTIGLVGSSIWSEKLQMCYGWELVELLRLMKDRPVKGIMIGDGSGIEHLKARCRDYGIEHKIAFVGRVEYEELPSYLEMIDVCLSTQTNDIVGQVRTTGKLPLYLAAGRFVLASDVGEASLVLRDKMLVEYDGIKDSSYPQKLVDRIMKILDEPDAIQQRSKNVEVAAKYFDYSILAERMKSIIDSIVNSKGKTQ
jgi:glycosyltransferase involved in cell wall biosynthesis